MRAVLLIFAAVLLLVSCESLVRKVQEACRTGFGVAGGGVHYGDLGEPDQDGDEGGG